jgi:L-ascorbate metabolism protein UlaG (beta-lactamase superfamily)
MRWLLISLATLVAFAQRPAIEARFIGNMAFAISDGTVTLFSDFPYESGYSRYMTYSAGEIRSATRSSLALITHRHPDHWKRELFEKTNWQIAGPGDVVSTVPAARVVPLAPSATFGGMQIEPLKTPHATVDHYSYVVTWHGRRLYFSGDTESVDHLLALKNLDVAFVSPWIFKAARRGPRRIDARQIVIYHHEAGETVPECQAGCVVPRQGDTFPIGPGI